MKGFKTSTIIPDGLKRISEGHQGISGTSERFRVLQKSFLESSAAISGDFGGASKRLKDYQGALRKIK